ncbi:hypothetical protein LPJ72_004158 [Coemansia sp. Benny D160-2]|nr:hypothetical protein LPJ72_004158 [Coemansia sp. Benny D160-2]
MSPVSSTKTTLAPLAWATNTGSASLQTLGSIAIVYPFSTSIPLLVTSFPTNLPQITSVSVASVQMNSQSPSLASTSERSLSLWKSNEMVSTTNPSSEFEITASASKWAQWSSSSTASESDASATASSPSTTSTSATSSSTSGSSTSTNSSTSTSTSISGSAGSLAYTPTSTNSYTVSLVSSSARSGDHLVAFSVHVPSPITMNTDDLVEVLISRPPISTQAAINSAASSVDSVTDIAGGWNNGVGSSGSTGISASASASTTSGSSSSTTSGSSSSSSDAWLDWPAGSYGIGGDSSTPTSADAHSPASNTPTPTAGPMRKRAAAAMALPSPDKVQYASQTRSIPPEALESARSLLSAMRNIATRSEKNIADHHMPNNVVRTMVGQTVFADDDGPDSNEFTGHVVVLQEALSSIISSMIGTLIPVRTPAPGPNLPNYVGVAKHNYSHQHDNADKQRHNDNNDNNGSHHYDAIAICNNNNRYYNNPANNAYNVYHYYPITQRGYSHNNNHDLHHPGPHYFSYNHIADNRRPKPSLSAFNILTSTS